MKKTCWVLFVSSAILIGLYPAIYFIIDRKFGLLGTKKNYILNDIVWNGCFYTHIILGGIALLIGWIQFSKKFRSNNLPLHKKIGKVYIICVLLSAIAGMYIAFNATGGWITSLAFITLDIIWFYTTITAFTQIKSGNIKAHENLMIYSYAATFGAVTLRIWLPLFTLLFNNFFKAYPFAAWMAFLPNMFVAFLIVRNKNKSASLPTT
jgi:uncharacterized membrane protein